MPVGIRESDDVGGSLGGSQSQSVGGTQDQLVGGRLKSAGEKVGRAGVGDVVCGGSAETDTLAELGVVGDAGQSIGVGQSDGAGRRHITRPGSDGEVTAADG